MFSVLTDKNRKIYASLGKKRFIGAFFFVKTLKNPQENLPRAFQVHRKTDAVSDYLTTSFR